MRDACAVAAEPDKMAHLSPLGGVFVVAAAGGVVHHGRPLAAHAAASEFGFQPVYNCTRGRKLLIVDRTAGYQSSSWVI